ncbi:MAG: PEP-CTERM sorting domain-containing protein [Pirellulales bacterium]|nr:PEP-CTERM sorting domain-containing protein [Pirellulales bacterium]
MSYYLRLTSVVLGFVLALPGVASAASAILTPLAPFQAVDRETSMYFSGFDVQGTEAAYWASGTLHTVDRTNGTTADLGAPNGYSAFNSFVTFSPDAASFYVGFTVSGNTDDRIYQVDRATGDWTLVATLPGNYDLEFAGDLPYVSGTNSSIVGDPNAIWLLDTTGADQHDKLIAVGGYSAGLGVDASGNVFYASADAALYRWDAAAVMGAVGASELGLVDATKLADLASSTYGADTEVDAAGRVLFTANSAQSFVAQWNGTPGDGPNYDVLALGAGSYGNWYTMIKASGDILAPGEAFYVGDFNHNGVAEVSIVPEPSTLGMILIGGVFFVLARRRK